MTIIYAVRTTVGREENVLEKVAIIVEKRGYGIKAMILPKEIKGYFLVEADNISSVEDAIHGINHVRGIVRQPVLFDEIKHFLIAKPTKIKISRGDTVELVSGPFKGEKAKVTRVDKTKREITLELVEAAVPIPVTVAIESIRVLVHVGGAEEEEREKKEKEALAKAEEAAEGAGGSEGEGEAEGEQPAELQLSGFSRSGKRSRKPKREKT